ncbi:hypothetical protein ACLI4Z_00710 [Natrialbaceae archaeon A-arb3/5]
MGNSKRLHYLLAYWIAPPVVLAVIATIQGIFLALATLAGFYAGWITDRTGFLIFFVVGTGVAIFAPPFSGGVMGYWKGMAWEVPVSVYFATVLGAAVFGRVDQAIFWLFVQAPVVAILTGGGMVVTAYVFSDKVKE